MSTSPENPPASTGSAEIGPPPYYHRSDCNICRKQDGLKTGSNRREHVVSDTVDLTGRSLTVESHCALSVEVHSDFVLFERLEHRGQRLPAPKVFRGIGAEAVHVDQEMRVLRKEGLLLIGFATVCAVRIRVDQLTDREPIGGLLARDRRVLHDVLSCMRWTARFQAT